MTPITPGGIFSPNDSGRGAVAESSHTRAMASRVVAYPTVSRWPRTSPAEGAPISLRTSSSVGRASEFIGGAGILACAGDAEPRREVHAPHLFDAHAVEPS